VVPQSGTFTCHGLSGGDSCSGPFFESGINPSWTLTVSGDAASVTSIGFDQSQISCAGGQRQGDQFQCAATWSRAGRACSGNFYLQAHADGSLTFSLDPSFTNGSAACSP
jgi:hypothetical protein